MFESNDENGFARTNSPRPPIYNRTATNASSSENVRFCKKIYLHLLDCF